MKKVYVIRHADKDFETGELTEEGRKQARALKDKLGKFDIVITKDKSRLTETAKLVAGKMSQIDHRAGFIYLLPDQRKKLVSWQKLTL